MTNEIFVTPQEYNAIQKLAQQKDSGLIGESNWYDGVKAILGSRTPPPYSAVCNVTVVF